MDDCVFCKIVAGKAPHKRIQENQHTIIIEPLNPHAPGHVLVLPKMHLKDALSSTADVMPAIVFRDAVRYLKELGDDGNILTSVGPWATQTVFHLHVHVIPRSADDGLHHDWPWMRENV